ncbi:MAG: diphosphate--fructose-6-phosphate 1-phosphotransferase, partial [Acetanaerobacterium sp.]
MHNNIMVAQSGGPTCAINASLAGVIREGLLQEKIGKIYGSLGGILGVLNGQIIDLAAQVKTDARLSRLERTPAMALGSCRYCMPDADSDPAVYEQILSVFHDYGIGYFFYIGGNDSMDTALKLSDYFKLRGEVICVVGIPKTIDNDLFGTDHSPGYGSAAKFIATSMSEMARDCGVYSVNSVTIAEIMGRNTGWLTAAAVLPRAIGHDVPQLVYLPEAPFDIERFLQDISRVHKTHRSITVAISEGIRFEDGRYVSESEQGGQMDPFGHRY